MENIRSMEEFNDSRYNEPIMLAYFGTDICSVCHATKPKVEALMKKFPTVSTYYCPADKIPQLSGQCLIFSVPAVLVFNQGKEIFRSARFIDLLKLEAVMKELEDNGEIVF